MTPEQLRAVIAGIVDAAARFRLSGEIPYANGLMDAADRLRGHLPAETPPSPPKAAKAPVAPPEPVESPEAKKVLAELEAMEEPKPRKRIRKPKGV